MLQQVKTLEKSNLKSIDLDGSATPILKARLALRIKKVLATAKERKLNGIGVMARPEADVGLLPLYQVLHRLEPDQGWLERALVTLAHTLHHALSQAQNIWWGFASPGQNWRFIFETSKQSLVEDCDNSPQIHNNRDLAELLLLVREYLAIAEVFGGRSFSKELFASNVKPLPDGLQASEWNYSKVISKWPVADKKHKEKLGRVLLSTMNDWQRNAWSVLNYGPKILAGEWRPHGTVTDWLHSVTTFDRVSANFAEVSYLDRVFGGSADDFLSALLGYSRYEHYQERWDDRVAYFNAHVPNALATNDQAHLQNWAMTVQREKLPLGAGIGQMLLRIILKRDDIKVSPLGKSGSSYFKAEYLATQGLLERKPNFIEEGVAGMLASYHKTDYAVWRGQWLSEICVPAVAIQRAALRSGIKIKIPADEPNDPELVQSKDPTEASLPFCLYPGIETILKYEGLAWPSLLLDEPITSVVE